MGSNLSAPDSGFRARAIGKYKKELLFCWRRGLWEFIMLPQSYLLFCVLLYIY